MQPNDIKKLTDDLLRGGKGPSLLQPPVQIDPLQEIWQHVVAHDQWLNESAGMIFKLGMAIDTARLTVQMLSDIIIENNMITKDEMNARYQKDVVQKLQEMQLEAKRQMEEAMAKAKAEAEAASRPKESEPKDTVSEMLSDIVLPSERNEIMTFPSRQDTDK